MAPGCDELRAAGVVEEDAGSAAGSPILSSLRRCSRCTRQEERRATHLALAAALEDPRRARPPPRSRHGGGERAGCSRARARGRPPRRTRSARDRGQLVERAAALTPEGDDAAATRRLLAGLGSLPGGRRGTGARASRLLERLARDASGRARNGRARSSGSAGSARRWTRSRRRTRSRTRNARSRRPTGPATSTPRPTPSSRACGGSAATTGRRCSTPSWRCRPPTWWPRT